MEQPEAPWQPVAPDQPQGEAERRMPGAEQKHDERDPAPPG